MPLKKYRPTPIFSQPEGYSTEKPSGLWYSCGDEWASWMRRKQTVEQLDRLARTRFVSELQLGNEQRMLFIRTPQEFDAFDGTARQWRRGVGGAKEPDSSPS